MKTQNKPDYLSIEENLALIEEPFRTICQSILTDNRQLFEKARGSTHNHQTWDGGYIDHITDGMNFIRHFYPFMASFGRPLPFSLSDTLLIFFLHDLEKPWRIQVNPDGSVTNREGLTSKDDFQSFRETKLRDYGLELTPYLLNAFTYIEGEHKHYSSERRVMNELAAFCHAVDTWSARGWYDYPQATADEWTGAGRFRTV